MLVQRTAPVPGVLAVGFDFKRTCRAQLRALIFFSRYDTFIERSCEQLNIARRQQMNVEITAKIKRLICCDGHYPSTTRRATFNYIDWTYHFS